MVILRLSKTFSCNTLLGKRIPDMISNSSHEIFRHVPNNLIPDIQSNGYYWIYCFVSKATHDHMEFGRPHITVTKLEG